MASEQSQVLPKLPKIGAGKIIGLISDTHVPVRARRLPEEIFKIFENAEYIIHAGDFVEMSVVDELEQIAPVLAVYGNMDGSEIRERMPKMNSLKLFNWKIGVTSDGSPLSAVEKR